MKKLLMVFALMVVVATLMAPVSASATLYSDKSLWAGAVGGNFANVVLPGTNLAQYESINLPYGGFFNFDVPLAARVYPNNWTTWDGSGGPYKLLYTTSKNVNNQYFADGSFYPNPAAPGTPGNVRGFGFEMEPFNFGLFNISLYLSNGSMITQSVNGNSGAKFFGWAGEDVIGFSTWSDGNTAGYAMANFVEANPVPLPGTMLLFGSGLAGLVGYGRMRFKK